MKRCIIQDYEVDALKNYESEFGILHYNLVMRCELSGMIIAEVADLDYPKFIDAINYEG
jgi:hypothetical protein